MIVKKPFECKQSCEHCCFLLRHGIVKCFSLEIHQMVVFIGRLVRLYCQNLFELLFHVFAGKTSISTL